MPPHDVRADAHAQPTGLPLADLWRVRSYLRPYLGQLSFMLVAACAGVGTEIAIPLLAKSVIDGAIRHGNRGLLLALALAATGLGAAGALLAFLRRWVQARAITGIEQAMREDLYAHLQRLPTEFHDAWQSGQLLSRATTDLSAIRRFAGFGLVFFITNVLTFVTVVVILIRLSWWLGLLTGAIFIPVVAVSSWFERRYRVLSRRAQDQQGDLATTVEEAASGVTVLRALGRGRHAAARHTEGAALIYRTQLRKARLRGTYWASLDLVPNAMIGLLLLLGSIATAQHRLTLGGLVAFITLTLQLVWPIEAMGYILAAGQEAATAAQRIYEILDTEPAITGPSQPGPSQPGPSQPGRSRARAAPARPASARPAPARLVLDRVTFGYPGVAAPVLRDISLTVEPGQALALTGATGTGKTTLLQLIPRLADPVSGRILIDGTDIASLPLAVLRARVGCAFEEATLFSASVRENVAFGAPDATEREIEQALATAQAAFAHRLPWGLDTRIGERGMALSGGQRQRIALARAILARPSVLVLDDPLSALDVATEEKVTLALHEVLAGTTAIIVAHRPSTVALADKVAMLADGQIAALGTHRELLASDAGYRALMSGGDVPEADLTAPGPRPPRKSVGDGAVTR